MQWINQKWPKYKKKKKLRKWNKPNIYLFQLQEVNRHPWVTAGSKGELELEAPMMEVVQTHIIPTDDLIDDDVLKAMNSLSLKHIKEFMTLRTSLFDEVISWNNVILHHLYHWSLQLKLAFTPSSDPGMSIDFLQLKKKD